jgi:hypothetical protein
MAVNTRYWFFQSSSDNLVRFTRADGFENYGVIVKNVEGNIGFIGPRHTSWYLGDRCIRSEGNQGVLQLPLLTLIAQEEQHISEALSRHSKDLELFCRKWLEPNGEGTLYVVLMDSERQVNTISMTLAFGYTPGVLIPDFSGVELDTIFTVATPITPANKVSRYERKWVI